jgi:SNF2 family DNA or RNA helicase
MLISLKAGGVGLTLTAADHVYIMDPWWNPAVEDQAADRAHRIGQQNPVLIHRLVARETIEEKILALQEKKKELARAVLDEGGAALNLTRQDLMDLLI